MDNTTISIDASRFNRLQMDRMADEDEDPNLREGIKYPGKHDVMLGRGGESTYHCGNISFRQLVEDHKTKYYTCPRAHKSRVVAEVVKKWRQLTPPGRFLTRTDPTAGDKSPWHDVGDGRALKKASHSLRDAVRCFSVEKKQRAAQAEREREEGAGGLVEGFGTMESQKEADIFTTSLPQQKPPAVAATDTRKRSRGPPGSNFFLSSSRVGGNKLTAELNARPTAHKKPPGSAFFLAKTRVGGTKLSDLVAAREKREKKSFVATTTTSQTASNTYLMAEEQQRPAKRQRAGYNEREESQDDCLREGSSTSSSSNNVRLQQLQQQQKQQLLLRRILSERTESNGVSSSDDILASSIPSSISWDRSTAPAEETFSFDPSIFGGSLSPPPAQQKQEPATPVARLPSPCGSADWFTNTTEDLPVQSSSSFSLPTADVLVKEVSVSTSSSSKINITSSSNTSSSIGRGVSPTVDDDDENNSLGWFSAGEPSEMTTFTSAPVFNVDFGLHRPLAVQSTSEE